LVAEGFRKFLETTQSLVFSTEVDLAYFALNCWLLPRGLQKPIDVRPASQAREVERVTHWARYSKGTLLCFYGAQLSLHS
jgi:hypothetical protein